MRYTIDLKKRAEAEKFIFSVFDRLDPSGTNTTRYKKMFASMSDSKFENFIRSMIADPNITFPL